MSILYVLQMRGENGLKGFETCDSLCYMVFLIVYICVLFSKSFNMPCCTRPILHY